MQAIPSNPKDRTVTLCVEDCYLRLLLDCYYKVRSSSVVSRTEQDPSLQ